MTPDFLLQRRARLAAALPLGDAVLVVAAGHPVPLPENSDQTYPFRSHAEYLYLSGLECPGGLVAFDPLEGPEAGWRSFVPPVTEAERVWEGRLPLPGSPLAEFDSWLATRRSRPIATLGAPLPDLHGDPTLAARIREAFTHARRPKDAHELDLLRRAVAATTAGFAALRAALRPGLTERDLQIELETGFFRRGATATGYSTIVGTGPNAAILHFPPSARRTAPGDLLLIDAGAEIDRYTADVTRTFVVGEPTSFQRDLHHVVLSALERATARCVVGAEWKAIHLSAAVDLVAGLVSMGVMHGDPASLVEQEAHTLFFPHGIGHMLGLGVRDASGLAPGRSRDPRPALRYLRMDLPLAAGYVVTVEPGLYFIPPILDDPARRARFHACVNWPLVDRHRHIGGVRIEDNILVTPGAPEVLTAAIPRHL